MAKGFTDTVMMIRPKNFGFNVQTANTNAFQSSFEVDDGELQKIVEDEFDALVTVLREHNIQVEIFEDTDEPETPDAIFASNWLTFHEDGSIVTYSMLAPNRRDEVRQDIVEAMKEKYGYKTHVDLGHYADARIFLEGTGSLVLDRENKVCYACLSPRTDERLLNEFCDLKGYRPVVFDAVDKKGVDIYHTNVMMSLGRGYALLCVEAVEDKDERRGLIKDLAADGREIIPIAAPQMTAFAGNVIHLTNASGEDLLFMSERARKMLIDSQIEKISTYATIVTVDIKTIEAIGGGSVRCMLAEIFKP